MRTIVQETWGHFTSTRWFEKQENRFRWRQRRNRFQMGLMILEHFALQVPDPAAMADWYVAHLGFRIARSSGEPSHARFLMARGECVMLELYRNPAAPVPNFSELSPVLLHIAYLSENLRSDRDRLLRAGAKLVEDYVTSPNGDQFVMLRDPWGLPLQLAKRGTPMLPNS